MTQKLSDIAPGKCAAVCGIVAEESMARRLMDIGMVQGTEVECLMKSPLGDPAAYLIKGAVIALRRSATAPGCQRWRTGWGLG